MKRATQANVTKALKAKGFPIELVQGDGYCYFVYDDETNNVFETRSEMVIKVSDLDFNQWIEIGEQFVKEMRG